MASVDEVVAKWAQEKLMRADLVQDAASMQQAWDATLELRKKKTLTPGDVDKWFAESFMNAPPLSHNTLAFNQVSAAREDLKRRIIALNDEPPEPTPSPAPKTPSQPAASSAASENKE